MKRLLATLSALLVVVAASAASPAAIVVLVSLDGWRSDYIDREPTPNLKALAARGVRARGLIPSFPSFTFPNHYTVVTGLYPGHHGIVSNTIDQRSFPDRFTMSAETARDPRWWGGEPIWVTAERQGRRTATMFWPGSEAPIGGVRPWRYLPFDDDVPSANRVAKVLEWLALPEGERPSFVTLYFSDVDHAGHDAGPRSPELREAVARLDGEVGNLLRGVARLGLSDRTTFVLVSDHGMAPTPAGQLIFLDDYVDLDGTIDFVEMGAMLQLRPYPGLEDAVFRQLYGKHPRLTIYKRTETPARFHYRDNPRVQPIVGVVDEGWTVTTRRREAERRPDAKPRRGAHGYDPRLRSMHGLFVAAGPQIRRTGVVAPFENIHIYEFLCALMDVKPSPNDGDPAVTRRFLASGRHR